MTQAEIDSYRTILNVTKYPISSNHTRGWLNYSGKKWFINNVIEKNEVWWFEMSNVNSGERHCPPPPPNKLKRAFQIPRCNARTNKTCTGNLDLKQVFPEVDFNRIYLEQLLFTDTNSFGYKDGGGACLHNSALTLDLSKGSTQKIISGSKKTFWLEATLLTNNQITLRSGSSGWGDCGSNTCGGCLENGTVELVYQDSL
jgi:hypothetical protein